MKKRFISLLLLVALLALTFSVAQAQTYRFQVKYEEATIFIQSDGTARVEYNIDFVNDPSADPIDFVDIGVPNDDYELSSVSADVNGTPITDIETSPYVSPGVALGLGSNAIQPGQSGRVHVVIGVVRNMLHPGTADESEPYASFNFQPNYFGSEFVNGQTEMVVNLVLPPGMNDQEPRYFEPRGWPEAPEPAEAGIDNENRVYYTWYSTRASASKAYTFGAAFPACLVPESAVVAPPPASINISDDAGDTLCCVGIGLAFAGFFGLTMYSSIWGARKRRMQYMPPRVAIEGNGIKRGLTSVEAAVLLEQPLDKIMTMILFSVIKKGAAMVVTKEPLKLEITEPLPDDLHSYEKEFLEAMAPGKKPGETRKALQEMMVNLIKSLTAKMKGFSHKETVAYYQDIMRRAWEQVEGAETPEVKMEKFDEYMGWTMLDKRWDDRTRDTFGRPTGPVFAPWWWGRYDPVFRTPGTFTPGANPTPSIPSGSSGGRTIQLPNLPGSDFAASAVGGIQSFAGGIIGDLTSFTGGVTNRTNPIPRTSSYSGRSGGGGRSCACACACAGCACACAGGGR